MNASNTVSASFSNVQFISRMSYSVVPVSLVLWYTFNDWTTGQTIVNNKGSYGATNNGTLMNGATVSTQTRGSKTSPCLYLNGQSQYMQIPPFLFGGGSFTVCFWYYSFYTSLYAGMFNFNNTGFVDAMVMYMWSPFNFYTNDSNAGGLVNTGLSSTGFADTVWSHVTLKCTFSTPTNCSYKLYANGINTQTFTGSAITNVTRTLNYIGKTGFQNSYPKMYLDDFRLYNVALTDAQITSIYTSS